MAQATEALRQDIEQTRADITQDVEALVDKASPKRVIERRTQRVKDGIHGLKERVMGSDEEGTTMGQRTQSATDTVSHAAGAAASGMSSAASTAASSMSSAASTAASGVSSAASTVAEKAEDAGHQMKRQAEGNPLAAGLIVFGLGWLASSLIPTSRAETAAAGRITDVAKEKGAPLADQAKEKVREISQQVREDIQPKAEEAAETVKERAKVGAQSVADDIR